MRLFLFAVFSIVPLIGFLAQENWVIERISFPNDLYTKHYVIERELPASIGDTLTNWDSFTERASRQLINTGLFKEANMTRNIEDGEVILHLEEALFILPIPFIDLADRNINEWWVTHNHQLDRLNLGLNLYHINLSGRNDPLKLTGQVGFIQKYYFSYSFPYFGENLSWQPFIEGLYSNQKEIPYTTINNRQQWYGNPDEILLERYRLSLGMRFRPKWNTTFTWKANYVQNRVGSDILDKNPLFLNEPSGLQNYLQASFIFTRDFRNLWVYPTNGHKLKGLLTWNGLSNSLNTFFMEIEADYWHAWGAFLSNGIRFTGRKYFYYDVLPFYQARALGYGDKYVRGYEYFVVDGSDLVLLQKDVKVQLFESQWDWGRFMFIDPLRKMPIELYANLYMDAGIVKPWEFAENNFLDEEWLVGYGIGLDVLVYRNFLFQFQYSRGVHGNEGFFIHFFNNY